MLVRRVTIVLLLLITTLGVSNAGAQSSKQVEYPKDKYTQFLIAQAYVDVTNYLQGIKDHDDLMAYLGQVQEQLNAYLEAITPPPPPPPTVQPVPAPTINNGAHSDAWWHGVSICEQGGRNDPFFGYFSIMDGSAGGLDWSTQVAMANAIIARAGDGAWAASCQAAGYSASPSG